LKGRVNANFIEEGFMEKQQITWKNMKNIGIGSAIALVLSALLLLGFSLLLARTDMQESTIRPVIILLSSLCILIGSVFTARKNTKNGMVNGGFVGGIYLLVLWIISSILMEGMSFTLHTGIMLVAAILTGMLGGIIGVNFAKTK